LAIKEQQNNNGATNNNRAAYNKELKLQKEFFMGKGITDLLDL
jgi:hypothetical protein